MGDQSTWIDDVNTISNIGLTWYRTLTAPTVQTSGTGATVQYSGQGVTASVSPVIVLAIAAVAVAFIVTR